MTTFSPPFKNNDSNDPPIVKTLKKHLRMYKEDELDEDNIIYLIFKLFTKPTNQ